MTHRASSNPLIQGLLIAASFLGAAAVLRWLSPAYLDAGLAHRVLGIMAGALVVGYANTVPKALKPLAALRCNPATDQRLRRFTGVTMVLGGIGYMLAWIAAPIEVAHVYAMASLGTALLLVIARCGSAILRRRGS